MTHEPFRAVARVIPIQPTHDETVVAALKAARRFLTQSTRVTRHGGVCITKSIMDASAYNDLNRLLCEAIRACGEQP